ncbi:MAG: hypothetical protein JW699_06035 [Chitinispirillaceae bacterium]|nr:hypothetical protein [Chitinispirillaceae bacterium]
MVVLCFLALCRNPFFPLTGRPYEAPSLRATPKGVIDQLRNSYEQRRFDLFEDLLPSTNTFRFYVSPNFVATYQSSGKYYVNPAEPRDTLLQYIGAFPYYYYWTQDVELQSHRRLFAQALSIRFAVNPTVNPGDFKYIVNGNNDTTNVEVRMLDGKIVLEFDMGGGESEVDTILVDKQVFFLERDAEGFWVIRKWYDFGTQP